MTENPEHLFDLHKITSCQFCRWKQVPITFPSTQVCAWSAIFALRWPQFIKLIPWHLSTLHVQMYKQHRGKLGWLPKWQGFLVWIFQFFLKYPVLSTGDKEKSYSIQSWKRYHFQFLNETVNTCVELLASTFKTYCKYLHRLFFSTILFYSFRLFTKDWSSVCLKSERTKQDNTGLLRISYLIHIKRKATIRSQKVCHIPKGLIFSINDY